MSIFLDLLGTSLNKLSLGLFGVTLKNSSGNLLVRNPTDTANANITASKLNNTGDTIDIGANNILTLSRNTVQAAGLTFIYPAAKATDGQVLAQKAGTAAGVIELQFVSAAANSQCLTVDTTSLAFGSSAAVPMFNLPADAVIQVVKVIIDTPFTGTPSMSVGIAGTTSKYLASNQVDLTAAAQTVFQSYPARSAVGTVEALQIAYTASNATVGSARIEVDYAVPS